MQEEYVKWSKDSVTIEVCIDDDSSPVIILDQREQEVDQWKIRPISSPPQVKMSQPFQLAIIHIC